MTTSNGKSAVESTEQSLPDYWREGSKKAAIAIDSWKLDIFKRHLKRARIAYSVSDGLAEGMLFITLRYNWVTDIQPIVEAANEECRNEQQDS